MSGAFAVIHPSGSRSGAAVRVRLQLRFKKMATSMKAATPSTIIVPSSMSAIPAALERSPAPRASTPQLPSLPLVTASTLTLECVRHVVVPQDFESESVFLSLTTVLDGHIVHNTAPALYSGRIEWEDVVSLHAKAADCDNITVILSAQNESNSKAAVLGSGDIDLSMLQLMKCISGWYSILDPSGNCVAYVKLRVNSASSVAAAASRDPGLATSSAAEEFSQPHHFSESVLPSTHNCLAAAVTSPVAVFGIVADSAPVSVALESDVYANATTAQSAPIIPSVVYSSLKYPQVRLLCALFIRRSQEQNERTGHCQLTSQKNAQRR